MRGIAPVQHLWASLAEIGCLEGFYRNFLWLPHNTHRTGPTPRRLLADRTGAKPASPNFAFTAFYEVRLTSVLGTSPPALCIAPVLYSILSYVEYRRCVV